MDSIQKDSNSPKNTNDIDLGVLLYKAGKAIQNLFQSIGSAFVAVFRGLLIVLLFIKENIIWLVIGAIVGLGYGFFINMGSMFKYYSDATVRTNFESSRELYNSVDYLNALIKQGQTNELTRIFDISAKEALDLESFEAEPVDNNLIVTDLYKERFLNYRRNEIFRQDTFWTQAIKLNDFKAKLTRYDYPLHVVTAISRGENIFPKLQKGLVNLVSQNPVLQRNKEIADNTLHEQEKLLLRSLDELDSLSSTYNKRLLQEDNSKEGGNNNLTLLDKSLLRTPELDLYDKVLLIRDELAALRSRASINQDILQVYTPFGAIGQKQTVLRQSFFKCMLIGVAFAISFILLIRLIKYLNTLQLKELLSKRSS